MPRKMKDSGVEWIGEIPEEWETVRLKSKFSFGKGLPITKENLVENGVPVISYGQIHAKNTNGVEIQQHLIRYVSDSYIASNPQSLVHEGDFIFADTSEDLDGCGNCVYVDREMTLFAGYHTIIFQSKYRGNNKYLAYLFKTDAWRTQIRAKVSGVKLFSISRKILSDAFVILPNENEQKRITNFLDRKCAEIDSVIAQTRASIEEYKKLKQAVITQAVTKGIRGDRPMKDSGIEWIGEIPEEWEVIISRFVIDSISDIDHAMPESVDAGIPYVMIGDLRPKASEIDFSACKKISEDDYCRLCKKTQTQKGDIIFARYATIGTVSYVDVEQDFVVSYACVTVHPKSEKLFGYYLYYYFKSAAFYEDVKQYVNSNTQGNVGIEALFRTKITVPPLDEQIRITEYLDDKCTEIDKIIEKKELLVKNLEAYKKSLIYEYVTGKKEVPFD